MDTSPLQPDDPRVQVSKATVRGHKYEYLIGQPPQGTAPVDTIFLIHGFPDLPYGWRAQVPYLVSLGFRVVVPAMLGYAGSDAPRELAAYTYKSVADDLKELAALIVGPGKPVIFGGHDWGGAVVWRVAMHHRDLVRAFFSVCTPYFVPQTSYFDTETIVANRLPNFAYQLQLQGPDVETRLQGEEGLRQFFTAMYGGAGPGGEAGFDAYRGVLFDNLPRLGAPRLLDEAGLAHYVAQYARQEAPPLRGPLNWYRTRRLNYDDELDMARAGARVHPPVLFVGATKDTALPPAMAEGMEKHCDNLTRAEVDASHWALTQRGPEVNAIIGKWLNQILGGAIKASL